MADWRYAWNWHHKLATEVFVGTDKAQSFISGLGLRLGRDVDVNAPEYGIILRGKEHLGAGTGVHPAGYNAVLKEAVQEWQAKNPRVKVLARAHIAEILAGVDPQFSEVYKEGKKAYITYGEWEKAEHAFKANAYVKTQIEALEAADRAAREEVSSRGKGLGGKLRNMPCVALQPVQFICGAISATCHEVGAAERRAALRLNYKVQGYSDGQVDELLALRARLEFYATEEAFGLPNVHYDERALRWLTIIPDDVILPEGLKSVVHSFPPLPGERSANSF